MINKTAFFTCSIFVLALLSLSSQASNAEQVAFDLPQPNGCHAVGTRTIVLRDPRRRRDLLVTVWYPAVEGTYSFAPYRDKKTANAVAEEWNLQADFERLVRTHARLLAPIAMGGPFPVVLLEHGSSVVPAIYTVLAEGLASNGFVVVATNHPPDSLIAVFPDGHELEFTPYWPTEADRRTQGVAIGKFADQVLLVDVRFVLDQLLEMNSRGPLFPMFGFQAGGISGEDTAGHEKWQFVKANYQTNRRSASFSMSVFDYIWGSALSPGVLGRKPMQRTYK